MFKSSARLYQQVFVSAQVYAEVVVTGAGLPGAPEVAKADWIEVKALENPRDFEALKARFPIGLGELATISLAKEIGAGIVLIDDLKGRAVARGAGLEVRGTIGMLETPFSTKANS